MLNLDRSSWRRVRLGDVISRSREQLDPVSGAVDRYVAGGHVNSDGLIVDRWGSVGDGQMGSTFRYTFRPGQVLFVSARPYLRKTGVPSFGGVVADKTYVLDAVQARGLIQEFLPLVLSSQRFIDYATAKSTGSMNPRLLWGAMQEYEFDLPPAVEQQRIGSLLWAVERNINDWDTQRRALEATARVWRSSLFDAGETVRLDSRVEVTLGRQRAPQHVGLDFDRPYLRAANISNDGIDMSDIKEMNFTPAEQAKFRLQDGDVLINEGSGTSRELGKSAVWRDPKGGKEMYFQKTLIRLRGKDDGVVPELVREWARWAKESGLFLKISNGTGILHLTAERCAGLPFPEVSAGVALEHLSVTSVIDQALDRQRFARKETSDLRSALFAEIFGG